MDKVKFLYYAPKILGGLQSLPHGRGHGANAARGCDLAGKNVILHPIPPDEFAVEAYVRKDV